MGICGGDPGEGCEQLAHGQGVRGPLLAQAGAPCVFEQGVERDRRHRPVADQLAGDQAADPIAAVLQLAADALAPVAGLADGLEVADGGDGLGADEQRHADLARGDGVAELVDQVLRALAAGHLQHGAGRIGADAAPHRAREIVRGAEGGDGFRGRDLELADGGDQVDLGTEGFAGGGVVQGRLRRAAGEVGGREGLIAWPIDALRGFSDPDDDRRARVHDHPPVVAAQPRPTNGILVAITVRNRALASGGRPAM